MKREETYIDVLMAENGIRTDKEMAENLGLSQQSFSMRMKKISTDTLTLISEFFDKPIKELLK